MGLLSLRGPRASWRPIGIRHVVTAPTVLPAMAGKVMRHGDDIDDTPMPRCWLAAAAVGLAASEMLAKADTRLQALRSGNNT